MGGHEIEHDERWRSTVYSRAHALGTREPGGWAWCRYSSYAVHTRTSPLQSHETTVRWSAVHSASTTPAVWPSNTRTQRPASFH